MIAPLVRYFRPASVEPSPPRTLACRALPARVPAKSLLAAIAAAGFLVFPLSCAYDETQRADFDSWHVWPTPRPAAAPGSAGSTSPPPAAIFDPSRPASEKGSRGGGLGLGKIWASAFSSRPKRTLVASSNSFPFPTSATSSAPSHPVAGGRIGLENCVRYGLEHSLDVRVASVRREGAGENVAIAKKAFQPLVSGTLGTESQREDADFSEFDAEIEKRFVTGTVLGTEFRSASDNRPGSSVGRFDPNADLAKSDVTLRLRQPLLKGGSIKANRAGVELARLSIDRSNTLLRAQVLEFLRGAETGYWLATIARELHQTQLRSLERSRQILADAQARYGLGMDSQLDVLEAEAAVAQSEATVVSSRKRYEDAVDNLYYILGVEMRSPQSDLRFDPISNYAFNQPSPDPETSYRRAMASYPEVLLLANEVKNNQQEVILARNNRLPGLDVEFSGRTSLSGDPFDNVRDGNYDWSALLAFSVPWTMKAERAALRRAKLDLEQSEIAREQGKRRLYRDILIATRGIELGEQQLRTAEHSAEVNARKFEEQRRRYQEGLVSVRRLREAEQEANFADSRELEARFQVIAARTLLQQIDGTILQAHGLQW